MGRHQRTSPFKPLRTLLVAASGIAAVAIGAVVTTVTGSGSSSAQMSSRTASGEAAYPPRTPGRVSRGGARSPLATPTPDPSETPPAQEAQPVQKKKRRSLRILSRGACEASYYGSSGGQTASGEAFDPDALTAAHRTLPLGSKVRVINRHNDRSVIVRINDRGPFVAGRCLDLSTAAMQAVGGLASGVIPVRYEVLAKA